MRQIMENCDSIFGRPEYFLKDFWWALKTSLNHFRMIEESWVKTESRKMPLRFIGVGIPGHVISKEGIQTDLSKIKKVKNFQYPRISLNYETFLNWPLITNDLLKTFWKSPTHWINYWRKLFRSSGKRNNNRPLTTWRIALFLYQYWCILARINRLRCLLTLLLSR